MQKQSTEKLHLAIIPDGNRRWAKKRLLLPWQGHEAALNNTRRLLEWCRTSGKIAVVTLWCFSTENWRRDEKEVKELMRLLQNYLEKEEATFHKHKTRVIHSGRQDRIPRSLASVLQKVIEATAKYSDFTLHLAIDYGGRDEVVRAVNRAPKDAPITENTLRQYLDHPELPDIDIIIRTSGATRTSNFCLWQSTYAEWFFLHKYFPELTPEDIEKAVTIFLTRSRRFGS
jgi:undecaprenyl diphosphate synthase